LAEMSSHEPPGSLLLARRVSVSFRPRRALGQLDIASCYTVWVSCRIRPVWYIPSTRQQLEILDTPPPFSPFQTDQASKPKRKLPLPVASAVLLSSGACLYAHIHIFPKETLSHFRSRHVVQKWMLEAARLIRRRVQVRQRKTFAYRRALKLTPSSTELPLFYRH
jgi:hypothetical protein